MEDDREWMYAGWKKGGCHTKEWFQKTEKFLENARGESTHAVIRCPCTKCGNIQSHDKRTVALHLCSHGYVQGYKVWDNHGESRSIVSAQMEVDDGENVDRLDHMLEDMQAEFVNNPEDPPTKEVEELFKLLQDLEMPLHGHTTVTILQFVTRLMSIKSKFGCSAKCYKAILDLFSDVLPADHKVPKDIYRSKKLLKALGMPYEKIDICPSNCMIYWRDRAKLEKCLKCGLSRYIEVVNEEGEKVTTKRAHKQLRWMRLTPRLKRLFLASRIASRMRWRKNRKPPKDGVMQHPCDSDAWKALDNFDIEFASEDRNVRIGLATDGFTPFSMTAASYSCWPVFAIPYNLPPEDCMKDEFMFLTLIIPGKDHPGVNLNVMLEPLIEELKELWEGVEAYDSFMKQKFKLRAAYLWSIHDYLAYGIFAGWRVSGRLGCPICGKETDCFWLDKGGKFCYFDCHRSFLPLNHPFRLQAHEFRKDTIVTKEPPKRRTGWEIAEELSNLVRNEDGDGFAGFGKTHNWTHKCGLWELPYMRALQLPHNIDVMHQERNMCEALFNTVMDFPDKTKDNFKARVDLGNICNRPTLMLRENGGKPRAEFALRPNERKEVMKWMKDLKFPDGYGAGFRRSVNLKTMKINGLKSHDYHIMMERLIPVMLRGYINEEVWKAIAELSYFYRQLCAKEILKEMMQKLEESAPVLLCKLEKIFPPAFFNPMQHLLIHLPYEAKVGGLVCYRWMYPIERMLKKLKSMVGNKAKVEGCIAEEFKFKEIAFLTSGYLTEDHNVFAHTKRYHEDETVHPCSHISIFQWNGKAVGPPVAYEFSENERKSALLYMWSNIEEAEKFFR